VNDNGRVTCVSRLPLGAYQKACRGCTFDGQLLTGCKCDGPSLHAFPTQQDFRPQACSENSISNDRGKLVCLELPGGPYIEQCRRCTLDTVVSGLSGCECTSGSGSGSGSKRITVPPFSFAGCGSGIAFDREKKTLICL
jgi:hypothetical protein